MRTRGRLVLAGSYHAAQQWLTDHGLPVEPAKTGTIVAFRRTSMNSLRGYCGPVTLIELDDARAVLRDNLEAVRHHVNAANATVRGRLARGRALELSDLGDRPVTPPAVPTRP